MKSRSEAPLPTDERSLPASTDALLQAIETFEFPEATRAEIAKYEPTRPSFELLTTLLP